MDKAERKAWGSISRGSPYYKQGLAYQLASKAYYLAGQESGEIDLIVGIIISGGTSRDYNFLNSPRFAAYCEMIGLDSEVVFNQITNVINGAANGYL